MFSVCADKSSVSGLMYPMPSSLFSSTTQPLDQGWIGDKLTFHDASPLQNGTSRANLNDLLKALNTEAGEPP